MVYCRVGAGVHSILPVRLRSNLVLVQRRGNSSLPILRKSTGTVMVYSLFGAEVIVEVMLYSLFSAGVIGHSLFRLRSKIYPLLGAAVIVTLCWLQDKLFIFC
jgi:hypothetical protein